MCVCVHVVWVHYLRRPSGGTRSSGAGITGGCKSAENQIQVFCKSNVWPQPPRYLSSSKEVLNLVFSEFLCFWNSTGYCSSMLHHLQSSSELPKEDMLSFIIRIVLNLHTFINDYLSRQVICMSLYCYSLVYLFSAMSVCLPQSSGQDTEDDQIEYSVISPLLFPILYIAYMFMI